MSRTLAFAFAVVLTASTAACSASGDGSGGTISTTTGASRPETTTTTETTAAPRSTTTTIAATTTTEPPGLASFDPCRGIDRDRVQSVLGSSTLSVEQGLLRGDRRFHSCEFYDPDGVASIAFGVLAADRRVGLEDQATVLVDDAVPRPVGLGDEALAVEDPTFAEHIVVARDRGRVVAIQSFELPGGADADTLIGLAEPWLDALPDEPPVGGVSPPGRCADIDTDRIETVIGGVALARGSDDGDELLRCDFYGTEDRWLSVAVSHEGGEQLVSGLIDLGSRWFGYDLEPASAVSFDGRTIVLATASDRSIWAVHGVNGVEAGEWPNAAPTPAFRALLEQMGRAVEG